jgi:sulfur carrier protein ThiS
MVVTVRLHTILRRQTPEGIVDRLMLDLDPGTTVAAVLEQLGIQLEGESILLVLNGRFVAPEVALADGDELRLVPAISGG